MAAAVNMPTDATPTSADLLGTIGVVVTGVPADGFGEVRVTVAGQPMKVYARADRPLVRGTRVMVIEVPSPTSVLVEPLPEALGASSTKEGQ
jgi:membrane protein implicated in regulation of membrane protease activity